MGAIRVEGLGKYYKRYPQPSARLVEWLSAGRVQRHDPVWVLRDVSFAVEPGDAVAIVGRNGAGKSTLLRLINQTLRPSEGELAVDGRVAARRAGPGRDHAAGVYVAGRGCRRLSELRDPRPSARETVCASGGD